MSIEIIKEKEYFEEIIYELDYRFKDDLNSGFTFKCDKNGNVFVDDMCPEAKENYRKCVEKELDVVFKGITSYTKHWTEPRIGKCHCGEEIELDGFTNTCVCGRDYNWTGAELAPREYWGEETGEHISDILRIK